MTGSASGVKKRQSGCRQCKVKRLKCDEGIPACTNCLRRGSQCPGYGKALRWSTKHERFGASSLRQTTEHESVLPQADPPRPPANVAHDYGLNTPSQSTGTGVLLTGSSSHFADGEASGQWGLPALHSYDEAVHAQIFQPGGDLPIVPTNDRHGLHGTGNHCFQLDKTDDMRVVNVLPSLEDTERSSFDPAMFYTPTHLPTILIEYWFNDVCPMWSIFDSDANFNRQFPSMTWASSEPVFYAMQSMSAACLVDTMPMVMPVLSSLTSKALAAIRSRVSSFRFAHCSNDSGLPADLLFAIFAMGTSLHWKFGYELGRYLIQDASLIIGHYKSRLPSLHASDRERLGFFQKALICWEGLLSAADRNFAPAAFVARRNAYQAKLTMGNQRHHSQQLVLGPPAITLSDAEIHPWSGVSSDVLQKFGQVLSLCHLARRRRGSAGLQIDIEEECDVGLARELASELSAMDFTFAPWYDSIDPQHSVTNDNDTPISHLLGVAEAYRQACFLQLCLTFEGIPFDSEAYPKLGLAISGGDGPDNGFGMTRMQGLVGLSLKLVEQLKKIPPESGSRCMQPMLYLCAASGLQIVSATPQDAQSMSAECSETTGSTGELQENLTFQTAHLRRNPIGSKSAALFSQEVHSENAFTMSVFKISQARMFVKRRLGMLQQLLPPTYASTTLRLAQAIWAEYDHTEGGGSPLYWFDVMVREKLQTFFG